jgi:hypothetical protein
VLAYVFWHRPRERVAAGAYEHAQLAFHRSLARSRPVGLRCSAAFRIDELPWAAHGGGATAGVAAGDAGAAGSAGGATASGAGAAYEDWYLLDDFSALGVLNEAAVGRGHRSAHDEAARRFGGGAGGLYALIEGARADTGELAAGLGEANVAVWVARPAGARRRPLGELLGDGMDPLHASLWRRQLVLGPASEFCLLAREASALDEPAGVARTRLPDGWSATVVSRESLWHG